MSEKTIAHRKAKRDDLFADTASRRSDFEFNARVAQVFDDMLVRSVPFYLEQQAMIRELAKRFFIPGTRIYDLGCSTGTTLVNLGLEFGKKAERIIGYDNSAPMLAKAREKLAANGLSSAARVAHADLNAAFTIERASLVTMCWTMQFVRPLHRAKVVEQIYRGLVNEGALIVAEKILTNSTDANRLFIELYYEYKRRNGYSDVEIAKKREALENILVPYRIDENLELFRSGGFRLVTTFFQWYNFVGFLCVKTE